jgi:hypothetical protein
MKIKEKASWDWVCKENIFGLAGCKSAKLFTDDHCLVVIDIYFMVGSLGKTLSHLWHPCEPLPWIPAQPGQGEVKPWTN